MRKETKETANIEVSSSDGLHQSIPKYVTPVLMRLDNEQTASKEASSDEGITAGGTPFGSGS